MLPPYGSTSDMSLHVIVYCTGKIIRKIDNVFPFNKLV